MLKLFGIGFILDIAAKGTIWFDRSPETVGKPRQRADTLFGLKRIRIYPPWSKYLYALYIGRYRLIFGKLNQK